MANLKDIFAKERQKLQKGVLIEENGLITNEEIVDKKLKKEYVDKLKNNELDFNLSYPDYYKNEVEKRYIPLEEIESFLKKYFNTKKEKAVEAPTEPSSE